MQLQESVFTEGGDIKTRVISYLEQMLNFAFLFLFICDEEAENRLRWRRRSEKREIRWQQSGDIFFPSFPSHHGFV